jgi:hypothetical protein
VFPSLIMTERVDDGSHHRVCGKVEHGAKILQLKYSHSGVGVRLPRNIIIMCPNDVQGRQEI